MRRFLPAAAAAILACGDPAGPADGLDPLWVRPEAAAYRPGATATLTLLNTSGERLRYSPCESHIERRDAGGTWSVVHQDQRVCPAVLTFLGPWDSEVVEIPLPADLASAVHRVRFPRIGVHRGGELVTVPQVGDSFLVQP
jgi:hypothetical protein